MGTLKVPRHLQQKVLLIGIDYRVRSTDNRFNLVYPFYVIPGEDQAP